jgi:hypothetical protein
MKIGQRQEIWQNMLFAGLVLEICYALEKAGSV